MVEVERARTIQRQRTKVESFHRVPTPHEKFDEYKTESLIEDSRFKLDLEVEPRPTKYVTNNVIQPTLSIPLKNIDGKYTIIDEKKFEDLVQREIREPLKASHMLLKIDFTRPYDEIYFRKLVKPSGRFLGLVRWSDEGLSDPSIGSDHVAKIKVEPGEKVKIVIEMPRVPYLQYYVFKIYIPSGVTTYIQKRYDMNDTTADYGEKYRTEYEGEDAWYSLQYLTAYSHGTPSYVICEFYNTSSDVKYVYVGYILCMQCTLHSLWKGPHGIWYRSLNNETFYAGYNLPLDTPVTLWVTIWVQGDGTNTCTAELYVYDALRGSVKLTTVSTSSTTWTKTTFKLNVERRLYGPEWHGVLVYVKAWTAGTGKIFVRIEHQPSNAQNVNVVNLCYDSNTQTIPAGGNRTYVIFDYTTKTKYANVRRIVLERDSELVDLIAKDENGNVIAQLKGSYPGGTKLVLECTHILKDILKLVVDVTNNDDTNDHDIRIYVEYEEVDAFLVR